jgi:hypothetical protein
MAQGPGIVALLDWMFAQDLFSQPPQNIAAEVSIRHDDFSVKKKALN